MTEEQKEEMAQTIKDAVANFDAEFIIRAVSDACYIASEVAKEQGNWPRMGELLHYARNLEQMPLDRD